MSRRKTTEEYVNECKQLGIDLPIERYVNALTKIKHKCSQCGNIYNQQPSSHLSGCGCPKCKKLLEVRKRTKTNEEYIEECKSKGYDLPIEPYVNARVKIKHKCNQCNNIYLQKPSDHLRGCGCPYCFGTPKKTTKQYIEECKRLGLDLPIEDYVDAKTPINHKCKQGHVYKQAPYYRLHYYCGCPYCSQSHGEKFIQSYLDFYDIPYIPQKTFDDLKDKRLLSYDFYLPKQNVLIEYQGIQHFIVGGNGNFDKDYFPTQQYHDKLKREYAVNNGYILLEPTYKLDTQESINKYLDKNLKGLL